MVNKVEANGIRRKVGKYDGDQGPPRNYERGESSRQLSSPKIKQQNDIIQDVQLDLVQIWNNNNMSSLLSHLMMDTIFIDCIYR
jgi:hypothetical protein